MMDDMIADLRVLVEQEQNRAMEAHGELHSHNECFGVLAEEVLEMKTAAGMLDEGIMLKMLHAIHDDEPERVNRIADDLMEMAISAAAEAVQVAAVCKRIIQF